MKEFVLLWFGIIFLTLATNSVEVATADHLEPGQGIFVGQNDVLLDQTKSVKGILGNPPDFYYSENQFETSNYQVYLQTSIRNVDGYLINITESTVTAAYIPHKITDYIFDTLMGKKEIITIDNMNYEKVEYTFTPTLEERWVGIYPIFSESPIKYTLQEDNRKKMNEEHKDRSKWAMHYCASFDGHGFQCIPVFQIRIPTMIMEPSDTVTHHWTILRGLD